LPARDTDSEVREGRKTVTVLASLIAAGSQASIGTGDPEAYRAATERAAGLAGGVIESHGGTVLDSRGGHVVGVFGIPRVHEDDAVRAVLAASELQDLAISSGDMVIRIRSGLATGEA